MGWFTVPPNDWLVGRFFLWMKKRWHSLTSSNRVWSVWTFDMFDASTVIKCYKSTSINDGFFIPHMARFFSSSFHVPQIPCPMAPGLRPGLLAISGGVAAHRTTGDSPSSDVRRKPGAWSGGPGPNMGTKRTGRNQGPKKKGLKSGHFPREIKS